MARLLFAALLLSTAAAFEASATATHDPADPTIEQAIVADGTWTAPHALDLQPAAKY